MNPHDIHAPIASAHPSSAIVDQERQFPYDTKHGHSEKDAGSHTSPGRGEAKRSRSDTRHKGRADALGRDGLSSSNEHLRDGASLPQPRSEEATGRGTHLERIAHALERIAEAVTPQARSRKGREEAEQVSDTDRALARKVARRMGLLVRGAR